MPTHEYERLARTALLEVTPDSTVGAFVDAVDEGDDVVSLRFANRMPGYPGWRWTVSVAKIGDDEPTVLEVELMPGDGSLVAPEWVPWSERLAEYRAAQEGEDGDGDDDDESDEDERRRRGRRGRRLRRPGRRRGRRRRVGRRRLRHRRGRPERVGRRRPRRRGRRRARRRGGRRRRRVGRGRHGAGARRAAARTAATRAARPPRRPGRRPRGRPSRRERGRPGPPPVLRRRASSATRPATDGRRGASWHRASRPCRTPVSATARPPRTRWPW